MNTLIINSKISDVLYSIDSFGSISSIVIRKQNGELLNSSFSKELIKPNVCFKSLVSNRLYYLRVYHKSNGDIVRKLKLIQHHDTNNFKNRLMVFLNVFYYRLIFSNHPIQSLEYCLETKKIMCKYGEGRYLRLLKNN